MRLIKEKIRLTNQDASIKIPLTSTDNRLGLQENINEFIERETGLSINPAEDAEKLLFTTSSVKTHVFKFYKGGVYDSTLTNDTFTQEEINDKEAVVQGSFFIAQYYDSDDINNQTLLHTSYLNGFDFIENGESTNYGVSLLRNLEFLNIYLPMSFLSEQENLFNIKARFFFFNSKNGWIVPFYNERLESDTTPKKLFFNATLNKSTKGYILGADSTLNIKEINNAGYRNTITDKISKRKNEALSPTKAIKFIDSGEYETE